MKTAWGWSAKLTRTIVLKDGTRSQACQSARRTIVGPICCAPEFETTAWLGREDSNCARRGTRRGSWPL